MEVTHQAELLHACRVLFGRDATVDFLHALGDVGVRIAYRRRALDTHPDRVTDLALKHLRTERFIETQRAYSLLREFLAHSKPEVRPRSAPRAEPRAARTKPGFGAKADHRPRAPGPPAAIPRRRLRLGEFLYHSRAISFPTLIEALLWQRRQRARFGEISRRWGYLNDVQIRELLTARKPLEPVGEAARRLRLLTDFQVRTVICFQGMCQRRIGDFFVERGHLPPGRLQDLLQLHHAHNAAFPR